jgi:hypothetical protein
VPGDHFTPFASAIAAAKTRTASEVGKLTAARQSAGATTCRYALPTTTTLIIAVTDHEFERLVRNVYKVLLTRGMIGTLIYSVDQETREMLRTLVPEPQRRGAE